MISELSDWKIQFLGNCFTALLPVPIRNNKRFIGTRRGTFIQNPDVGKYHALVKNLARASKLPPPLTGMVKLEIQWVRSARRGDTSGIIKTLEDSLQNIFYLDDKQIDDLHITRKEGHDDYVMVWCSLNEAKASN